MRVCTGWMTSGALVQTVDFFTPIVDDPFVYGRIAAANALSDVYAMGGRPLTALAIAAFPDGRRSRPCSAASFAAGSSKLREAGVALLGGHTVQDQEIKFGYAVTGEVDPARFWPTPARSPGDVLFLTKPLGTGVVATAMKFDRAPASAVGRGACIDAAPEPRRLRGAARRFRAARSTRAPTSPASAWSATRRRWPSPAACTLAIDVERGAAARRARWTLVRRQHPGRRPDQREHFAGRRRASSAAFPTPIS